MIAILVVVYPEIHMATLRVHAYEPGVHFIVCVHGFTLAMSHARQRPVDALHLFEAHRTL